MNTIPEEFQINTLLNQDTYLVDGELKKWTGQTTAVFSTIFYSRICTNYIRFCSINGRS
jgi:hypothetical protein